MTRVPKIGMPNDMKQRQLLVRTDNDSRRNKVLRARELIYERNYAVCGPVRVKVGVKDNQTTNTQVTAIMRDVGLRNYGEFNEPVFCNEAVLWAVDENGWALLACRSV